MLTFPPWPKDTAFHSGVWANGDDVGYSFHGQSFASPLCIADPTADFTNGWPLGFFKKIFDNGRQCSVQFRLDDCPAFDDEYRGKDGAIVCPYNGVEVVEVSLIVNSTQVAY